MELGRKREARSSVTAKKNEFINDFSSYIDYLLKKVFFSLKITGFVWNEEEKSGLNFINSSKLFGFQFEIMLQVLIRCYDQ